MVRRTFAILSQFEDYGKYVFAGKVANEYMSKQGLSGEVLKDPNWVNTHADEVANAVFQWYESKTIACLLCRHRTVLLVESQSRILVS